MLALAVGVGGTGAGGMFLAFAEARPDLATGTLAGDLEAAAGREGLEAALAAALGAALAEDTLALTTGLALAAGLFFTATLALTTGLVLTTGLALAVGLFFKATLALTAGLALTTGLALATVLRGALIGFLAATFLTIALAGAGLRAGTLALAALLAGLTLAFAVVLFFLAVAFTACLLWALACGVNLEGLKPGQAMRPTSWIGARF